MTRKIEIALLGTGTVGSGVIQVLQKNYEDINQKIGAELVVKKVLVRNIAKKRPLLDGIPVTDDFYEILNDKNIEIIVELMGGSEPAHTYMLKALEAGKSVVTANKDVVAQYGYELYDMAEKHNVDFMFEASVGGGIPIITPLKQCLTANKITEIMGILNGTTNYMLTKMAEEGADYYTVLKEAQKLGYAEANPSADVDGFDAARKIAILASIAFNTRVSLEDVSIEGITSITPDDIDYAKSLGYVIKLLAVARDDEKLGVDVRVHPVFLPKDHPLASVNDVFNAIYLHGNAIGDAMFYGRGAGSLPTASAVLADVMDIARDIVHGTFGRVQCTCYNGNKPICPVEETYSPYYLRLLVSDKPGVLGTVASVFGEEGVSIKSVIQARNSVADHTEIVAISHTVKREKLLRAIRRLEKLPVVDEIIGTIRVDNRR